MPDIPLRLRLRRDGSLCLTDGHGQVGGEFPTRHLFLYTVLARHSQMRVEGEHIHVELANATATYKIDRLTEEPQGLWADLELSDVFDAPAIDEAKADELAAARED